ncbi:hypothetical protein [Ramlibacter albus]|uniref:Uncharacterized protein n=1 Tax=Ramlibacter albus TaxID=2079448 RepID=A0A923S7V2_9BURK|nr:hypothetical protein [Ramlibacter albus]MBC5767467.1 hypothetical protein [Ramlibacter albus]
MKFATIIISACIAFTGTSAFAQKKDDHTPKHGGIWVETKALDFEIVAKPELIQVYVGDHGKPVKLDGAKGKVTLLNGSEKSEVELAPTVDKLEAKGSFKVAKGTKGIVSVTLAGKPAATARFEVK